MAAIVILIANKMTYMTLKNMILVTKSMFSNIRYLMVIIKIV
jgi:hypothetical protein